MTQVPDKPTLNDEMLEHYGVLGMHWGVTRAKANTSQIKRARRNVTKDENKYERQADKVDATTKNGTAARAKGESDLAKLKISNLKNPDRVIAARLTRGEKTVFTVLGLTLIPLVAPVVSIGATSAISRRIEYKQKHNKY